MKEFTIAIRIPGWAQNKPIPSDLYYYLKPRDFKINLKINKKPIKFQIENGFAKIQRIWKDNDVIELNIPMSIRRVLSHTKVEDNTGKVTIERGPIVYCIESVDNEVESVFNLILPDETVLKAEYRNEILYGIVVITGELDYCEKDKNGVNTMRNRHNFLAIPYYAWAYRGKSEMTVWMPRGSIRCK